MCPPYGSFNICYTEDTKAERLQLPHLRLEPQFVVPLLALGRCKLGRTLAL
jgi:hypothetical protein